MRPAVWRKSTRIVDRNLEDAKKDLILTETAKKGTDEGTGPSGGRTEGPAGDSPLSGASEEYLYERDRILTAIQRKLSDIAMARRGFEKELDELEKEYRKLAEGSVLELPAEFEEMLEQTGLRRVYGMEWLKKNGNSVEKKSGTDQKAACFFHILSILSRGELEKLIKSGNELFTSFPIPIIKREDLEDGAVECDGGIVSLGKISFYVLFNDNLLDEEKLA